MPRVTSASPATDCWRSKPNSDELAAHHQDPFDRILVAQALIEPMRLMTHDATVALYGDTIIKV